MDKELKQLIQTGEGYHLEFKESLDKSLIEEVCAFANSSGGKVLLGVSDDGEIKGISTDNNILSRIQDVVNRLEPKLNIKISVSDSIIIVDVPQGGRKTVWMFKGIFYPNWTEQPEVNTERNCLFFSERRQDSF